jgi:6-phosphogluconolactonase
MLTEGGIRVHADPGAAAFDASGVFRHAVESSIWVRGRAGVALSGGRTPRLMYENLGGTAFQHWTGWKALHMFWVDERAVPATSKESNFWVVRDALLDRAPLDRVQVHRLRGDVRDLEVEAERYARLLDGWAHGGPPRLDLVLLGLGDDGHTASLFPGSPALAERERWVVTAPGPPPHERRLTLTLPVLNAARVILFLVTGAEKAEIVSRVLEGDEPADRLPARAVRPVDGRVYWVLDRAAAARLRPSTRSPRAG